MKKLSLSFILLLSLLKVYSQNTYNLLVQANYVRVWAKPVINEVIPNTFLKFGEKVRVIDAVLEDRQVGMLPERFCRVYRMSDNTTPYYLNIAEVSIDLRTLQLRPSPSAVTEEKPINNTWMTLNNTFHKKGEIIFFDGKNSSGIYSFLNKAALNKSDMVNNKFTGFYNIENIVSCKVEGTEKVFFYCKPLKSPFNEQKENNIYIDFFVARNNIDFQSFTHGNIFFTLLLDYAYKVPTGDVPDNNFYTDYLSSLYGQEALSQMDEFKRQRIFNAGKTFMDSVFNDRMKVLSVPLTNVFYSSISGYDFNNKSFTISALSNTQNELTMLLNKFSSGQQATGGFINLPLFNPNLPMDMDVGESFSKEIKSHELNPYSSTNDQEVVLIVHFKYISAEKAKVLYKKFDTDISDFNYQKVIDSIEVYSGNGFTRSDVVVTNSSPIPDKSKTKKWATLFPKSIEGMAAINKPENDNSNPNRNDEDKVFTRVSNEAKFPGGEEAFKRYIKRAIGNNDKIESGTCKVRFIIDKDGKVSDVQALTMKGSRLADIIVNAISKGPRWSPAILNDHYVKAFSEQQVTFPIEE